MSENFKFWLTILIAGIGALSWIPQIMEFFKKKKISVKIISQYNNFTKDRQSIFLLYKLSVISINCDFYLKNINLSIMFESSDLIKVTSCNMRKVIFTHEVPKQLNLPSSEFLNNLSVLQKNVGYSGYLFFKIPYNKDEKIKKFILEFVSELNEKNQSIEIDFDALEEEKMLFDDSIWKDVDKKDLQIHYNTFFQKL